MKGSVESDGTHPLADVLSDIIEGATAEEVCTDVKNISERLSEKPMDLLKVILDDVSVAKGSWAPELDVIRDVRWIFNTIENGETYKEA